MKLLRNVYSVTLPISNNNSSNVQRNNYTMKQYEITTEIKGLFPNPHQQIFNEINKLL